MRYMRVLNRTANVTRDNTNQTTPPSPPATTPRLNLVCRMFPPCNTCNYGRKAALPRSHAAAG